MRVRYFAWFETKHEKTEFVNLIKSCRSDMEAIGKVMDKYPDLNMSEAAGIVDNFKKEINTK
jgi:hypothetical protein